MLLVDDSIKLRKYLKKFFTQNTKNICNQHNGIVMNYQKFSRTINLFFMALFFFRPTFSQHQVPFSVFSSGGTNQSNSSYNLVGTIGQAVIGNSNNTTHQTQAGFWQLYYQSTISYVASEIFLPLEFKLDQNYPNPFNPSTFIRFTIPERANVQLKVYDLLGGEITTLVNEDKEAGWYNINFNAAELASGFYIYRIKAGNYSSTKKMLIIK